MIAVTCRGLQDQSGVRGLPDEVMGDDLRFSKGVSGNQVRHRNTKNQNREHPWSPLRRTCPLSRADVFVIPGAAPLPFPAA